MRPLPPTLLHRPFTVDEASALGVTRSMLRRADLRAPHRGVRVPAALPDTVETRARAALLVLPGTAAFSGLTAAQLCELPQPLGAPDPLDGPVRVTLPSGGPRHRVQGVDVHLGGLAGRTTRVGRHHLPVVHPAHLWVDLAGSLPFEDAVALADGVRCRWADAPLMAAALAAAARREGVEAARSVWPWVRHRVDSAMETRLRLLLVRAGLPEPLCGRDVVVDGQWIARPDLAWVAVRVAVEFDGDHHRTDRRQWQADVARRRLLEEAGWLVLAFTADDVLRHPEVVVRQVAAALRARGLSW